MFDDNRLKELESEKYVWDIKLGEENKKIFANYDLESLSDREKRKIIFDYLVNNSTYDHELFDRIKRPGIRRNYIQELSKYADTKIGVCHTMAEYYKMLLGYNNIYSICVTCMQQLNGALSEGHMINLVYDDISRSYSFDDINMTVLERDYFDKNYGDLPSNPDKYFNYDLEMASRYGQGNEKIIGLNETFYPMCFLIKYLFYYSQTCREYKKYGLENPETFEMDYNVLDSVHRFDDEFIHKK